MGGCGRNFCPTHDGRHLIDASEYRGKICIECAPEVEERRKMTYWAVFAVVMILAILVLVLIIAYGKS